MVSLTDGVLARGQGEYYTVMEKRPPAPQESLDGGDRKFGWRGSRGAQRVPGFCSRRVVAVVDEGDAAGEKVGRDLGVQMLFGSSLEPMGSTMGTSPDS